MSRSSFSILRAGRNWILRVIGWRYHREVHNHVEGSEDEGAIELTIFESRPWWENDHIVESKPIDWEQDR